MKTVTIHCTWRSTHQVEVPDDFDGRDSEAWMDQVDTGGAYLADWDVIL